MRLRFVAVELAVLACSLWSPPPARADAPAAPPIDPEAVVGVVKGEQVNLRVGPRQDDAAVMTLEKGEVVVIVERAGDWLGVRIPAGFLGFVSAEYTEPVDAEHVRITGTSVNVRRFAGLDQPPFRDRLERGDVVPVTSRDGDWVQIEAPESIRAYVAARFVEEKGPASANGDLVEAGRKRRAVREALRAESSKKVTSEGDEKALRDEIGAATKSLADARAAGGYDVASLAAIEDRLDAAMTARTGAGDRTKAMAKTVLDDVRREQAIRVAFADEILAKKRAGQPSPTKPTTPPATTDAVDVTGTLRWEPAPGWDGGGAFVLWVADKPVHALRWAGGDLRTFADKKVAVRGKPSAARLLGLPALDVSGIALAP